MASLLTILLIAIANIGNVVSEDYFVTIDATAKLGRQFEGIGAISGGGPNYAASLQILKVEIGGDSQSTEGTEASHMHSRDDLNCERGYEGWLMKKAKQVNPNLKFQALPWAFPGWLGDGISPYGDINATADYIVKWLLCMKNIYEIDIDAVGIWNERQYNIQYIEHLRQHLDESGFASVKIVASDQKWNIAFDIETEPELAKSVYAIGAHYPGTTSLSTAKEVNKPLWASEDFSTFNDDVGSGCWARILNQNYVNGLMTSTIAWNLVASYFDSMPFPKCSLMTANQPWSGHYEVKGPIWITAHTTQFVDMGWAYLGNGTGVGHLEKGGSYVSLVSPDRKEMTVVIETMVGLIVRHDHSKCIRPFLPSYTVEPGNYTFSFKSVPEVEELHVYMTQLRFDGNESSYFAYLGKRKLIDGSIKLSLGIDQLVTLSTRFRQQHRPTKPPVAKKFPLPYHTDFQIKSPALITEPEYLTAQTGYFELVPDVDRSNRTLLRQMTPQKPLDWCDSGKYPVTLMGYEEDWINMTVNMKAMLPENSTSPSVFLVARFKNGGCDTKQSTGLIAWFDYDKQEVIIAESFELVPIGKSGMRLERGEWYDFQVIFDGQKVRAGKDNVLVTADIETNIEGPGFVGLGCGSFSEALYREFGVSKQTEHSD